MKRLMSKYLFKISLTILLFFTGIIRIHSEDIPGTVTANKLNVRIQPNTKYAVISKLKRDDKVTIRGIKDKWYKIETPADVSAWIPVSAEKNGIIIKNTFFYSGPNINYTPFGAANKGQGVKIVKNAASRKGWLEIKPPPESCAWVHSDFIRVSSENLSKLKNDSKKIIEPNNIRIGAAPPAKEDVTVSDEDIETLVLQPKDPDYFWENQTIPPLPSNQNTEYAGQLLLPFISQNPEYVFLQGILLPVNPDAVYVTHALAIKSGNDYFPVCYLHGRRLDFVFREGAIMQVRGNMFWVEGWRRPVVMVDDIRTFRW